jgi:NADPH:quinone reductase-like Zn-dependent oxidoreductase
MQAIVRDRFGSPEVLALRDIDEPEVGDGEVLVRVRAASVNPADWYAMAGTPWIARADGAAQAQAQPAGPRPGGRGGGRRRRRRTLQAGR